MATEVKPTATPAPGAAGPPDPARQMTERAATSAPGVLALVLGIAGLAVGIGLLIVGIVNKSLPGLIVLAIVLFLAAIFAIRGLTPVTAGQARVVQLFGSYRGTVREPGLQWVNPFADRRPVSTRIRNHETPQAKVNDADGNPIEISAVVVWRVEDTAKALY